MDTSTTLGFFEMAWARARELALAGRRTEALAALDPLLADAAPAKYAALAHRLAARMHFNAEAYRTARHHLRVARLWTPADAEAHYELGLAWERDPNGSDRHALASFRRAYRLQPEQAKFLAAYGRALVRNGRAGAGVKRLRAALELTPAAPAVVRVVAEGLREAGRGVEAHRAVTHARFLAPRCREIARLFTESLFARAARPTRSARITGTAVLVFPAVSAAATVAPRPDGPAVLRSNLSRTRFRQG